jgi:type II secretion system protein H
MVKVRNRKLPRPGQRSGDFGHWQFEFVSDFEFPDSGFGGRQHSPRHAFTLVELLLVMTIMVVTISVAAPTLANFFRGRTLDAEARRLLALTHSGQSRAVFEGVPMRLWVDEAKRSYGLEEEPGWVDHDPKAVDFKLDQDLHIEIIHAETAKPKPASPLNQFSVTRNEVRNLPEIRFLPDGTIDETSPRALRLSDRNDTSVWLAQATNRMNYEIRNEFN